METKLRDEAAVRVNPFLDELLETYQEKIHSIHITGSALTPDFDPKRSDINSILVLQKMDLKLLESLAPLGKKYGKKRVAAPLIMTPEYIHRSLDAFPIEFLNIKRIHKTVAGEDLFEGIEIKRSDLRIQCERELKVRLIGLRQGYLSASGDRRILTEGFVESFSGYIPLFRGIILLLGEGPPVGIDSVLSTLQEASGVDTRAFRSVMEKKKEGSKFSIQELNRLFTDYYTSIEKLGRIVDAITE